jgi:hypothetical protein
MMERLLARCVAESDGEVRLRLAACLGEVGAIGETMLGELAIGGSMGDEAIDSPTSSYKWRLDQPPWHSQEVKYELQLVIGPLVVALKAAPSSTDQHKIAFAIQQLLHLLNSSARQSETAGQEAESTAGKDTMTKWLKEQLKDSGHYDLIEPYFSSDFKEKVSHDKRVNGLLVTSLRMRQCCMHSLPKPIQQKSHHLSKFQLAIIRGCLVSLGG